MSDPELANHYATLSGEATQEGNYAKAEHYLGLALQEDRRCVFAYANLSVLYGVLGRQEEALQAILQALECDPHNAVVLFNVGSTFMRMGNYQQAAAYLKRAVLEDPNYSLAAFNLAMCYDISGQLDDALLWYQRAAELDPSDPDPVYNIAEIHFRKGALVSAEGLCLRSLHMFDDLFRGTQVMPYMPIGESLPREEVLAEIAYKKASAYYLLALIQANQGRLAPALQAIRAATEIHPHKAKWFLLMGQICHRLGYYQEAQAALTRARRIDPSIAA
jgi:tetratricopeptide (TPR) repeat protein